MRVRSHGSTTLQTPRVYVAYRQRRNMSPLSAIESSMGRNSTLGTVSTMDSTVLAPQDEHAAPAPLILSPSMSVESVETAGTGTISTLGSPRMPSFHPSDAHVRLEHVTRARPTPTAQSIRTTNEELERDIRRDIRQRMWRGAQMMQPASSTTSCTGTSLEIAMRRIRESSEVEIRDEVQEGSRSSSPIDTSACCAWYARFKQMRRRRRRQVDPSASSR
jgi:hypothetical protein